MFADRLTASMHEMHRAQMLALDRNEKLLRSALQAPARNKEVAAVQSAAEPLQSDHKPPAAGG